MSVVRKLIDLDFLARELRKHGKVLSRCEECGRLFTDVQKAMLHRKVHSSVTILLPRTTADSDQHKSEVGNKETSVYAVEKAPCVNKGEVVQKVGQLDYSAIMQAIANANDTMTFADLEKLSLEIYQKNSDPQASRETEVSSEQQPSKSNTNKVYTSSGPFTRDIGQTKANVDIDKTRAFNYSHADVHPSTISQKETTTRFHQSDVNFHTGQGPIPRFPSGVPNSPASAVQNNKTLGPVRLNSQSCGLHDGYDLSSAALVGQRQTSGSLHHRHQQQQQSLITDTSSLQNHHQHHPLITHSSPNHHHPHQQSLMSHGNNPAHHQQQQQLQKQSLIPHRSSPDHNHQQLPLITHRSSPDQLLQQIMGGSSFLQLLNEPLDEVFGDLCGSQFPSSYASQQPDNPLTGMNTQGYSFHLNNTESNTQGYRSCSDSQTEINAEQYGKQSLEFKSQTSGNLKARVTTYNCRNEDNKLHTNLHTSFQNYSVNNSLPLASDQSKVKMRRVASDNDDFLNSIENESTQGMLNNASKRKAQISKENDAEIQVVDLTGYKPGKVKNEKSISSLSEGSAHKLIDSEVLNSSVEVDSPETGKTISGFGKDISISGKDTSKSGKDASKSGQNTSGSGKYTSESEKDSSKSGKNTSKLGKDPPGSGKESVSEKENSGQDPLGKDPSGKSIISLSQIPCTHCSLTFETFSDLIQHMSISHDVIISKCSKCGQIFYNPDEVKKHLLIHKPIVPLGPRISVKKSGKFQHRCQVCWREFRSVYEYRSHMMSHPHPYVFTPESLSDSSGTIAGPSPAITELNALGADIAVRDTSAYNAAQSSVDAVIGANNPAIIELDDLAGDPKSEPSADDAVTGSANGPAIIELDALTADAKSAYNATEPFTEAADNIGANDDPMLDTSTAIGSAAVISVPDDDSATESYDSSSYKTNVCDHNKTNVNVRYIQNRTKKLKRKRKKCKMADNEFNKKFVDAVDSSSSEKDVSDNSDQCRNKKAKRKVKNKNKLSKEIDNKRKKLVGECDDNENTVMKLKLRSNKTK